MIKKYENITLESTSNEKIKELEGKTGILEFVEDILNVVFTVKKQKLIIPVISYIGDFSDSTCNEMWVRDGESYTDYTFIKSDKFEVIKEGEE